VLREALTTVMDNAIKYSPEATTITVSVQRARDQAQVAIRDEGPGIPPEHRERIFHRFFRIDEARSRDRGGTGLGLAIAKWAVEINGGQISVGEGPRGGAEFRIVLPLLDSNTYPHAAPGRVGG
jgi:signal transduction histidine kinase